MNRIAPFLLLLLLLAGPAFADAWSDRMDIPSLTSDDATVEKAMKELYVAEGADADYAKALAAVQKLADGGNAEAAFRLGRYYDVETPLADEARALALYKQAADKGHGFALNNLGILYERGGGVPVDLSKAKELYEQSAKANDHHGYLNLARLYFQGIGVRRNKQKGLDLLNEAMNKKITGSFLDMANILRGGFFDIPEDRPAALNYYRQAAALGDSDAAEHLAFITLRGDCTKDAGLLAHHRGSPECVPENPRLGMDMLTTLADKGNRDAMTDIGSAYWDGSGDEADGQAAVSWWQKAADLGDCRALKKLANAYKGGRGVQHDETNAQDYLEQAAACNPRDSETLFNLGRYYFAKSNPNRNCAKAERYLQRAVANGKREAYTDLGYIYDKGCAPVAQDQTKAFGYYLTGAKLGVALCQGNVGVMLRSGNGVKKDIGKGFAWLQTAVTNKSAAAKKTLEDFDVLISRKDKAAAIDYLPTIQQMLNDTQTDPALAFDGKY